MIWTIVAAAGIGRRMHADRPKQYLPLVNGHTVLEKTLENLLGVAEISQLHLVLAEHDPYWPQLPVCHNPRIVRVNGGRERCHSIMQALQIIADEAAADDLVLVHDAARPCVRHTDIKKLIAVCRSYASGGLLAIPVRDTMKQAKSSKPSDQFCVEKTLNRSTIWHALTPQIFRFQLLFDAMRQALSDGFEVTDEASAVEHAGFSPALVEGHADNIKITRAEDLGLAAFYIQQQGVD